MASLLKRTSFSSLRAHHQAAEGLILQSRRQIHVEPGVREKAVSHYMISSGHDSYGSVDALNACVCVASLRSGW
ncbi:hypothetical protein HanOQP8_Chr09g0341471 [Helianthus annuus]|nr:hypothetical protein HanIR_Chr09g0442271 [Helianthus annuus]KAJ0544130.1 hypothetical protein HanHA89_Chr09g0358181 [Helianthus annuus]KAJ0713049.1 hypothetical protein HanOQP8_Chr09g0341471 [Helianthus annuus]